MLRKKMVKETTEAETHPVFGIVLAVIFFCVTFFFHPVQADENWTGDRIMDEVFKRHELFPYVFEDETIILIDRAGNRDTRKARRFSRVEKDGTVKYLLVFDNPAEIRGVALLAFRRPSGDIEGGIYLPAFGKQMKSAVGQGRGGHILGTDFSVGELTSESSRDFRYVRVPDRKIDKITYFVVEAFPKDEDVRRATGYGLRRNFIRQDNFFIVRIDYYDLRGRLVKRQTRHDLKRVGGDMWRADMVLMENLKERHKTLIKVNRRIFSRDYVPPEIFTKDWLFENRHLLDVEKESR